MTKDSIQASGLTHTVLALLFMAVLIAASYWVLHRFLAAMVWAAMIVISTWPLMQGVQAHLWGRRSLAAAFMTLLLIMVLVLPAFGIIGLFIGPVVLAVSFALLDAWVVGDEKENDAQ